jgi:hypothetical protein
LIKRGPRKVAGVKKPLGPAELNLGKTQIRLHRFYLRKGLYVEGLVVAHAESRLSLAQICDGLFIVPSLLDDLVSCLLESDLRVARIEPDQNAAFCHKAADVEVDLSDLARHGRCDIGRLVAREIARRLEVSGDRLHDGLRRRHIDDRRLCVGVRVGIRGP